MFAWVMATVLPCYNLCLKNVCLVRDRSMSLRHTTIHLHDFISLCYYHLPKRYHPQLSSAVLLCCLLDGGRCASTCWIDGDTGTGSHSGSGSGSKSTGPSGAGTKSVGPGSRYASSHHDRGFTRYWCVLEAPAAPEVVVIVDDAASTASVVSAHLEQSHGVAVSKRLPRREFPTRHCTCTWISTHAVLMSS
jgi:hypothetical protein